MEEKITDEDRNIISTVKNKAILAASQADKAVADAKVAELEYHNTVMKVFLKYGMGLNDTIDETGSIKRTQKDETPEQEQS